MSENQKILPETDRMARRLDRIESQIVEIKDLISQLADRLERIEHCLEQSPYFHRRTEHPDLPLPQPGPYSNHRQLPVAKQGESAWS